MQVALNINGTPVIAGVLPSAPKNVIASGYNGQVILSWDTPDPDEGVTSWTVNFSATVDGVYGGNYSVSSNQTYIAAPTTGHSYWQVIANNSYGPSLPSAPVQGS